MRNWKTTSIFNKCVSLAPSVSSKIYFPSAKPKAGRFAVRHRLDDPSGEKIYCTEYLDPDEILYIQKNNGVNTVKIGLLNGEVLDGINGTLKEWEAHGFFQIHRRNLINLHHVRREEPRLGENLVYKVVFKNNPVKLDIGPDFLPTLRERLKKLRYTGSE